MKKVLKWLLVVAVCMILGGVIMAHEKVYVVCENMCMEEGMTKEQINSGLNAKSNTDHNHDSRYKQINDFAVITGTIQMPEANAQTTTGSINVNYPTGFTKDNCIVISIMGNRVNNTSSGWATPQSSSSLSYVLGNCDLAADMQSSTIRVLANKPNVAAARYDIDFKLVLMRID